MGWRGLQGLGGRGPGMSLAEPHPHSGHAIPVGTPHVWSPRTHCEPRRPQPLVQAILGLLQEPSSQVQTDYEDTQPQMLSNANVWEVLCSAVSILNFSFQWSPKWVPFFSLKSS